MSRLALLRHQGVGLATAAVLAVGGAQPRAIRMSAANERAAWRLEPIPDPDGSRFAIMFLVTIVEMCPTELVTTVRREWCSRGCQLASPQRGIELLDHFHS